MRARDAQLAEKDERIALLTAKLHEAEHELAVMKKQIVGPKTERMPTPDDEAKKRSRERPSRGGHTNPDKRKKNAAALAALPTCVVPHPIPDDERRCPHCGEEVRPIGEGDVSFEIEWIPGRLVRRKHVVETGRCRCKQHYARGPAPERVEEGCTFGPAFIAKLVVDKCGDAIPIYRVEKRMRRQGIPLSRSTMNDLLLRAADLLERLYDVALAELRIDSHLQADETSFRMQGQRERVFVWAFLSKRYTLYVFSPSRSGDTPKTLLEGTTGALVCDGHSGYNVVTDVDCRTRGGCWCHARRKLFEALPAAPDAREALDIIIDLFLVEREADERNIVGTPEHLALRRDKSAAALNKLLLWMKETKPRYEPSSAMGKAIGYMVNQWARLTAFMDDPRIPIHNNASESALRIVAMARKSSLFFGNEEAARRLVILYSLVATCEKNGVNPEVYIRDVLMRLPSWSEHRIGELLPHRWKERFGSGFATESSGEPGASSAAGRPAGAASASPAARDEPAAATAPHDTTPPSNLEDAACEGPTAAATEVASAAGAEGAAGCTHETTAEPPAPVAARTELTPSDLLGLAAPVAKRRHLHRVSPRPPTAAPLSDPRPPPRHRAAGASTPRSPPTRRRRSSRR